MRVQGEDETAHLIFSPVLHPIFHFVSKLAGSRAIANTVTGST